MTEDSQRGGPGGFEKEGSGKMRICIVTRRFSLTWGGAERVAVNLSRRLSELGHEVNVITASAEEAVKGVNIRTVGMSGLFSPWRVISFQRNVSKALASQRYDIVYSLCHVYPVDIYRMSDGIHRHWMRVRHPGAPGRWFKYLTSLIHPAMVWLEGRLFSGGNCRLFVTNSRLVKGQVMKIFGIQADRIRVIYNGVDHAVFNSGVRRFRGEMRRKAGIGEGELVLLFVANNWERKGLSTVIRAAAKSRAGNLRIVVIGRGREERFRLLAAREGLRPDALHFPGHTREVEKWYGMADFFVLPTMYEPFANVCLEAMACGLPCITTRTNGAAELIRDGENGFVLERWDDSDGLSEMIGKLGGSDFRLSMGEHAAKEAGLYTWERHIRETEELFEYYIRSRRN